MDAFTESDGTLVLARNTQLGRLSVGGDAAYSWGSFQPWAGLTYNYDYELNEVATAPGTTQPANDDDSVTLDLGCAGTRSQELPGHSSTARNWAGKILIQTPSRYRSGRISKVD